MAAAFVHGVCLAVADVDGVLVDRERGFLDRFAQGRVRVNGPAEVFAAAAEFHHRDDFRDQLRGGMRQNRGAENSIGRFIRDKFHQAFDVGVGERPAIGAERKFTDPDLEAIFFR